MDGIRTSIPVQRWYRNDEVPATTTVQANDYRVSGSMTLIPANFASSYSVVDGLPPMMR